MKLTLRDMGIRGKDLIRAAREVGIPMDKDRASKIINGVTVIRPDEMEVIAKLLNKTVDEVYRDIGSLYIGIGSPFECEFFDWERYWRIKDLNGRYRSAKQCILKSRFPAKKKPVRGRDW